MRNILATILGLAAMGFAMLLGGGAAGAAAQSCPQPDLALSHQESFWASYTDYQERQLSAVIMIVNDGDGAAHEMTAQYSSISGGVRLMTELPAVMTASLDPGAALETTLRFRVPPGTLMFRFVLFVSAGDECGGTLRFPPGPWPGDPPPAGCPDFPEDNIWNVPVDSMPLDANSDLYVESIGAGDYVHADFGSGLWEGGPIGIPSVEVPGDQPGVPVSFEYADESDPGPYPVPADAPIEGGSGSDGDRHILVIDREACRLYELYHAFPQPDESWQAGSGAIFDLSSNVLRPSGWTSADAAGLPIYPGLVKYEEVAAGEIRHAIRFTAPQTRREYIWPARHYASWLTGAQYPPMGQRFRLKADFDVSGYSPEVQVILTAMKRYGIILSDNGAPWYISGSPDERWDNDHLHELHQLRGSDFEAVDVSSLMVDPDSAQARVS